MKSRSRRAPLALLCPILWSCGQPSATTVDLTVARGEIRPVFDAEFVHVREVVRTEGAVWVLDGAAPFLTRIDLVTGEVIRRGSLGRGPGEFGDPIGLQIDDATRTVHVWDIGTRRHSVLDAGLGPIFSEPVRGEAWVGRSDIRDVSYADPYRVRLRDGELLFTHHPRRIDRTADWMEAALGVADLALAEPRPLVDLGDSRRSHAAAPVEFIEVSLWDACGGEIAIWRPASHTIEWLDRTGAVVADILVDVGEPRRLDEADIAAYLERMARLELGPRYDAQAIDFRKMARSASDRFSDIAPDVVEIVCAGAGAVWLRLFDNRTDPLGRGSRWLAVTRSGEVVRMEFPEGFRPFAVTEADVLGALETERGTQRLAEWRRAPLAVYDASLEPRIGDPHA